MANPTTQDPEPGPAGESAEERAERAAGDAVAADAALTQRTGPEHEELLGFYDRLRERVLSGVERHVGRWSETTVEVLLLAPDLFLLLVRLSLDRRVPKRTRALIGGTLAYFVLPMDLLPEAILGPVGYLDDLVLTAAVLSQAFGGELEKYTRVHWSGTHELAKVLERINSSADALLGRGLYERLRALLARHGIKLGG